MAKISSEKKNNSTIDMGKLNALCLLVRVLCGLKVDRM